MAKTAGNIRADGRMMPAPSGVRVRMYCQGLGDCFLLCFRGKRGKGDPVYMLIDCGVILGTPNAKSIMQKVVKSISDATGGHIHYLLATHQHWDHLSGFIQARDQFEAMTIDNIWLAWTEDPANPLASALRGQRDKMRAALTTVANRMKGVGMTAQATSISTILEFFGESKAEIHRAVGATDSSAASNTQAAMAYLSARGASRIRFRHPGEPQLTLPEVDNVRIYVLGPPEDERLIKRSNPSAKGKEVYELAECYPDSFFAAACQAPAIADSAVDGERSELPQDPESLMFHELSFPFDQRWRISTEKAETEDFFKKYYFGLDPDVNRDVADQSWRQIDNDWLGVASELALNPDSNTNNTSLAIAIELLPSQRVLLFPGDAQVGNWLSWERYSWPADRTRDKPVTAADLLSRTVFYKVGHHGSHNATLREHGLELMQSEDLVAMIPVDHEMAVTKRWPRMPFEPLLKRLGEKTRGRIVSVDKGIAAKPDEVNAAEWDRFMASVRTGWRADGERLFFECDVMQS